MKTDVFTHCLLVIFLLSCAESSSKLTIGRCLNRTVLKGVFALQVPGLYKSSSVDNISTTKIKPLVPARVSGLSKKPSGVQKRNHHNAENRPGLQIKINELWKNFGFKK